MDPSVLQKYEEGECLGSGGQGSVYKVVRRVDGDIFAMKVLKAFTEEEHKKNVEEVRHMLKLKHRNLIPCLDFFETTKQLAKESLAKVWQLHIVMPLYGKGDLYSCVQKEGPLSPERAHRLLQEMGGVLQLIHGEGFIHRDVKPQNIMVSGKGPLSVASVVGGEEGEAEFILADLGLSKEVSSSGVANSILGTPAYMAPDFNGKDGYTNKVDMWALGVTVCQVVLKADLRDLFLRYLHHNRELVMGKLQTHLPPALWEVVFRLLSTDPLERPSASEMLQIGTPGIIVSTSSTTSGGDMHPPVANNTTLTKEEGRVALVSAVSKGDLEEMRELVLERGVDPGATGSDGFTALHYAARENNCVEVVAALVSSYHQDPGVKSNVGWTPVHQAAEHGSLETVKYLVETLDQDCGVKSNDGWTPVHQASRYGHFETVKYLVETCGSDAGVKNNNGWAPVHLAAQGAHVETVKYFVETRGHLETVKYLIETCGQDAGVKCNDGRTPVHQAAQGGHLETVKYLVETLGQDTGLRSNIGWTPVHLAARVATSR